MNICQKLQIEQYSTWLSSSLSSVKLLIKVRNYVMPLNETDSKRNDETGFCSKVRLEFHSCLDMTQYGISSINMTA